MICCMDCFCDPEIRGTILSLEHKGTCPICGKKDTWIYDSETDFEKSAFEDLLSSVIQIYKPEEELNPTVPESGRGELENQLSKDWKIFAIEPPGIRKIAKSVIINSLGLDSRLLSQKVGIPELYDEKYLEEHSVMGSRQWEDFKFYLRNSNRFHSRYINLNILKEVLEDTITTIPRGTRFYRARTAKDAKGYQKGEMGAPPDDKATPGRANSKGISCLYLASKRKTTVKEIRAGAFDYVTVATFKLNRDVKVVDLSAITHSSPFYAKTDKVKYLLNEMHLRKIENDLAKPVSSRDSDLDYLPTQYISDFAKLLGYDGVKYISTFDKESFNLALFHPEVCDCTYKRTFVIGNLDYKLNAL